MKLIQKSASAVAFAHKLNSMPKIVGFGDIRDDVFNELTQHEKICGVKWTRFPSFNRLLKGHRPGELTIFSGRTGVGKTTLLSEYSLDLCESGVKTLWGSFEIKYPRLAKIMLHQLSRVNLRENLGEFDLWANHFERLPMFFLELHGPERLELIIQTLHFAVQEYGVEHIVVDNLQFMLGIRGNSMSDRFHEQDKAVESMRALATRTGCHVTLVVHPRKEDPRELLTSASIYGGAKVTQEADNILMLQRPPGRHYVEVEKNRFDGELGHVPLSYCRGSFCFSKSTHSHAAEDNGKLFLGPELHG